MADPPKADQAQLLNLTAHPTARQLVSRCLEFFEEIKNLTPGQDLEKHLNTFYGPTTPYYRDFSTLIRLGLAEGWVASDSIDGQRYR
ncbi:hypothetical protein P7C71_g5178, partial [Lecanoromycetidae sp. Uapishka_2]